MKKIKYIIGIVILVVISCITIVYADYLYDSSNVEYNNSNSTLNSTSVQDAIDELYTKVNEMAGSTECPSGYEKITDNEYVFKCACENRPICKRATTLHNEVCNSNSYCGRYGYAQGATITYGSLGTSGSNPASGDAFDCDVNGDGTYDSQTERFYYVSTYFDTKEKIFDADYYVFIFYSSTNGGVNKAWYSVDNSTSYGPLTAITFLPTTSQWRDDLLKIRTRNILSYSNYNIKENFNYEGYAARLLTYQELKSGCPNASTSDGSMYNCPYFFENTRFSGNNGSIWAPWLESTYYSGSGPYAWYISSDYCSLKYIYTAYSNYASTRPVIEVHKSLVSY